MSEAAVGQVRSFNRLVTERVGALERSLPRPGPAARRGPRCSGRSASTAATSARLRSRLDLDSGYLSRLLRSLEAAGLVTRRAERARPARPDGAADARPGSPSGSCSTARSDELARSFLEPLSETRRERLVAAMAEVERLLTAALVEIAAVDPAEPRRAALPPRVLRRARPPVRDRASIPALSIPADARRARGRRPVLFLRRDPARRARRLRRAEVPRRRADRAQAHVGRRVGARPRDRPAAARRAREPRARAPASRVVRLETNRSLDRGDRALPLGGLPRGRGRSTTSRTPTTGSRSACPLSASLARGKDTAVRSDDE